jgi:hypothetical protein
VSPRRLPDPLYYRLQPRWARFWTRHLARAVLVHINKTGGSSVEKALGMPFQHRTALELIELMGRERWERCFTFAFVRDPWDKVASHYRYRVKTRQTGLGASPIPFGEWVRRAYGDQEPRYYDQPKMFMPQSRWICDAGGHTLVDFVGRFERLEADFAEVCRRLGREAELPHLKKSSEGSGSRAMYDAESAAVVAEVFAEDLERFGYRFEG